MMDFPETCASRTTGIHCLAAGCMGGWVPGNSDDDLPALDCADSHLVSQVCRAGYIRV